WCRSSSARPSAAASSCCAARARARRWSPTRRRHSRTDSASKKRRTIDRASPTNSTRGKPVMTTAEAQSETSSASSAAATKAPLIECTKVSKTYHRGKEPVQVLKELDLTVEAGAFEALMGPSGSGKSTLLNLIAGLDKPSSGTLRVADADLGSMSEGQRAHWRAQNIGFVFQTYNLMPVLSAVENVELPLLLTK